MLCVMMRMPYVFMSHGYRSVRSSHLPPVGGV